MTIAGEKTSKNLCALLSRNLNRTTTQPDDENIVEFQEEGWRRRRKKLCSYMPHMRRIYAVRGERWHSGYKPAVWRYLRILPVGQSSG